MIESEQRYVVLSLHKSGTNLVSKLFSSWGVECIGEGVASSYSKIKKLKTASDYKHNDPNHLLVNILDKTDNKSVVFIHKIVLSNTGFEPTSFFEDWLLPGRVKIIFNYRDPRAICASLARYLGSDERRSSSWPWGNVQHEIINQFTSPASRIDYCIDFLADHIRHTFEDHYWAFHHPEILNIRYENLVGDVGGGNRCTQLAEIDAIAKFMGIDDSNKISIDDPYDTKARTFSNGSANGWRNEFSSGQLNRFNCKYQKIVEIYGHEV